MSAIICKVFEVRKVGTKKWTKIESYDPEFAALEFGEDQLYPKLDCIEVEVKGYGKWEISGDVEYSAWKR